MTSTPGSGSGPTDETVVRRRWRPRWAWLAPAALGFLGSVVGLVLFTTLRTEPVPITRADVADAAATAVTRAAEGPDRSTQVYRVIFPSLVLIRTDSGGAQHEDGPGIGSGVIIRDDGMILTAHHVVEGARTITVTFADGTESTAEILDALPNDLAILHAAQGPELIVPAVLGGGVQIGDETFAVGNPLGLTASLSAGVISGINRTITAPGGGRLTDLIQFDAAVNPGSSGGPLLNRDGQVIGIVTALANPSRGRSFTGIGFAAPLGTAGGPGGLPR